MPRALALALFALGLCRGAIAGERGSAGQVASLGNLTVEAVRATGRGAPVKLNITWSPPEVARKVVSYSVSVSMIPNSDKCHGGSLYYTTKNKNQLQVLLPEMRFSTEISELSVLPGCTYNVHVYANPRIQSGEKGPMVTYTVPTCLTTKCCTNGSQKLPAPEVQATVANRQKVEVKWTTNGNVSDVHSYIVSVGTPLLKSKNGLSVFNKTVIYTATSRESSFLWSLTEAEEKVLLNAENRIFVVARDSDNCLSEEGAADIVFATESSSVMTAALNIVLPVCIVGLAALIMGLSLFLWKYYLKQYRIMSLRNTHFSSMDIKVCKSQQYDSLLKNRNILYVEREIEEALQKGDVDQYEISFHRLKIISELGKGQFGKVYLASLEDQENVTVAVKMSLCSEPIFEDEARQQMLEEIATLKTVGEHPNLVGLVGCCTLMESPVCLVLEYMEGGDLLAYLQRLKDNGKMLENKEILRFSLEITRGMEHLESKGIIHRDLAARNVLLSADCSLKIADFGLSRNGVYIIGNGNGGVRRLPVRWMSPESVFDRVFSSKSDVWSFAVVLWEIGTLGNFPYSNMTDQQLLQFILNGGRLEKPASVSTELYNTMCLCWASRAMDRPSFGQLLPHLEAMFESRYLFEGTSNPCCLLLPPAAVI